MTMERERAWQRRRGDPTFLMNDYGNTDSVFCQPEGWEKLISVRRWGNCPMLNRNQGGPVD